MKNIFQIVGWASFLACSWTWCIGMFLPVILMRDYGPLSWLMFAVPNVIGAAGMGYLIKRQEDSLEIVNRNKLACTTFSIVTILFQIYFLGWISIFTPKNLTTLICVGLILLYFLTIKSEGFGAIFVWLFSLLCILSALYFVPLEEFRFFEFVNLVKDKGALLSLTPICTFGFLLCPYLDLTFHKVRQSNNHHDSKIIFTLGFAVMFLVMILFTFVYSEPFNSIISGLPLVRNNIPDLFVYAILLHIFIQAGFTSIIHITSLQSIQRNKVILPALLISAIIIYILPKMLNGIHSILDIDLNEIIYRSFMAFYALIAPSYIFYFIFPKNEKNAPLNKHNLIIWIAVILLALPFYAIGFLGIKWHLEFLSLIGLTIILGARKFIKAPSLL